jgi:hypothetical protein
MFDKSKLAAILKDEGLTKTAYDPREIVAKVNGRPYDRSDVEEMLDGKGGVNQMYRDADNLPKWLMWAGHKKALKYGFGGSSQWVPNPSAKNFPGGPWDANKRSSWDKVAKILQMILDNPNAPARVITDEKWVSEGKGLFQL